MTDNAKAALEARRQIDEERLKVLKASGVTFKKVVNELAAVAFANIQDFVKVAEGGEIQGIAFDTIPKKKLKAVKKIKEYTRITESADGEKIWKDSRIEYKLYDKVDVLKYLVKLLGEEPADKHELISNMPIEVTANVRIIKSGAGSDKKD
jgi:hypothetical protein